MSRTGERVPTKRGGKRKKKIDSRGIGRLRTKEKGEKREESQSKLRRQGAG